MVSKEENELLTRVGPGTPGGELLRRFWFPALMSSELPEPDCPPIRVRLLGEDLVAFRDANGQVGLLAANCPHRGASLFFGRNEEAGLRCVYHGWKFDVAGNCVDMPSEPAESNFKDKIHHTAYPCIERAGVVWTYMGPREHQGAPPELEWARVPKPNVAMSKYLAECSYLQCMEGDIDSAHVSFLHSRLQLDRPDGGVRQAITGGDRAPRFTVKDTDYGLVVAARRNAPDDSYYWRISQWLMPFYPMIGHDPGVPMSGHALVPVDDEHTWFWLFRWVPDRPLTADELSTWGGDGGRVDLIPGTWRPAANRDNDYGIDRTAQRTKAFTGIAGNREQDLAMTESMGSIYDRTREHLGATDLGIIAARRRLLEAVRNLQVGIEPYPAQHPEVYRIRPTAAVLKREIAFDADPQVVRAMVATV